MDEFPLFSLEMEEKFERVCGEIILTTKGRIVFYCTLCGKEFCKESYLSHLVNCCSQNLMDSLVTVTKESLSQPTSFSNTSLYDTELGYSEYEEINVESNSPIGIQSYWSGSPCSDQYIDIDEEEKDLIFNDTTSEIDLFDVETNEEVHFKLDSSRDSFESSKDYVRHDSPFLPDECEENEALAEAQLPIASLIEEVGNPVTESEIYLNDQGESESSESNNKANDCSQLEKPAVVRKVLGRHRHLGSHITDDERKFKCAVCGLGFKDKSNMNYHCKRHTNEKNYDCPKCDKKFFTSSEVKNHLRVHSLKRDYPFLCTECGRTFSSNFRLVSHQKKHRNQKDFICPICEKGFYQGAFLTRHMTTHSSERKFSCNICQATFKRSNGLKYHMKQHENKCKISKEQS